MTLEQKHRYNSLLESLRYIASHLKTLDEAKLYCSKRELDYQEYLEVQHEEARRIATKAIENRKYVALSSRTKD